MSLTSRTTAVLGIVSLLLLGFHVVPVQSELQKLDDESLSKVSGQEGLRMILNDFQISGSHTLRLRPDDLSNDVDGLFLSDVTVDNAGSGINIGSRAADDPITFDVEGSDGGRWVIELPENNIDATDITIDDAWIRDESFNTDNSNPARERRNIADGISITNAQWAGGTRFALGTKPGGGLQMGLGIVLDGDLEFSAPTFSSEVQLNQIGGFGSCSGGPTNFDIDFDCSGVLDWAQLESDRALNIEFFDNGSQGQLSVNLQVPSTTSPSAGQIVVEEATFNGTSYGEIWTDDLIIADLEVRGPISTSSDMTGKGTVSCSPNEGHDTSYCLP